MLDRFRASIKSVGDAVKTTSANTRSHLEEVDAGVSEYAHEQVTSIQNQVVILTIHLAANLSGIIQSIVVGIGAMVAEVAGKIDAAVWAVKDWVRGLIAEATAFFTGLIDDISARLESLTSSLEEAKEWLLSQISQAVDTAILQMRQYVDCLFAEWSELLNGLDDIKDEFFEFFDDPLEWLWARFTDWFLGEE